MADRTVLIRLGGLFLCLYLLTAGGHYGGDGFWSYLTAESIVLDGDLKVGDRSFLLQEMASQHTPHGGGGFVAASGRRYSPYGLGLALVEVPFYAAGHLLRYIFPGIPGDYVTMLATGMTNTFVCAAWCLLFFQFARQLGYSRPALLWLSALFGLGSMVFPYAGYGFSEPLVGLSLLGAVWALHRFRRSGGRSSLVWAGLFAGFAAFTKIYSVITLPFLIGYLWFGFRGHSRRDQADGWASFLVPLATMGFLVCWHNWTRYGDIFSTGYHVVDFSRIGGFLSLSPLRIGVGLYGLLASSGRGLLLYLPVAVLIPLAFWRFRRSHPHEALLFGLLSVEHLLFYASYGNWHGGSCWGPRFLLPVLPFLILPLGGLLEGSDPVRQLAKALVILGLIVQIPAALSNPHLFLKFVQEKSIGDTVFYRNQPEDPLFSPSLCPVAGGYYQVASALSRWTTGASLTYPVPPAGGGRPASLASYDLIDVWWLNALRTGRVGSAAVAGIFAVIGVLVSLGALSARHLVQWAASVGRGPESSPHCSRGDR